MVFVENPLCAMEEVSDVVLLGKKKHQRNGRKIRLKKKHIHDISAEHVLRNNPRNFLQQRRGVLNPKITKRTSLPMKYFGEKCSKCMSSTSWESPLQNFHATMRCAPKESIQTQNESHVWDSFVQQIQSHTRSHKIKHSTQKFHGHWYFFCVHIQKCPVREMCDKDV